MLIFANFLILFSRFCFASMYFIELQNGTNNFISYHHHNIVIHRELCNLAMRSASGVVIHRYNQDLCRYIRRSNHTICSNCVFA